MTVQPANKQHSNTETSRIKAGGERICAWSKGVACHPHGLNTGCAAKGVQADWGALRRWSPKQEGCRFVPIWGKDPDWVSAPLLPS